MANYLTIKQYATLKNISAQAVYKQVNGRLNPYIVKVDGKTLIDFDRLTADENTEKATGFKSTKTSNQHNVANGLNTQVVELLQEQIEELKADRDRWHQAFNDLNERWKGEQEQLKIESVKLISTTASTDSKRKGWFNKVFSQKGTDET